MEKVKIELNYQQIEIINEALINLPYRVVVPVIRHINAEISRQVMDEQERAGEQPQEATADSSDQEAPSVKIDGKDVPLSESGSDHPSSPGVTVGIVEEGAEGEGSTVIGAKIG